MIRPTAMSLVPTPLGPGYSGPETYFEATTLSTSDGALTIGTWAYDGQLISEVPGERHHAWIVARGRIEVEQAGEHVRAETGDLVLFEAPYPSKTVWASSDFLASWITVPRSER